MKKALALTLFAFAFAAASYFEVGARIDGAVDSLFEES